MNDFGERYVPVGSVEAPYGELIDAIDSFHARPVALLVRAAAAGPARDELVAQTRALMSAAPHPNLCTVRDAFFAGDQYTVVMDRPEGQTLARLLAVRGEPGLQVSTVLGYLEQLAAAVDHLHRQRPPIVHGDIGPDRVVVTADDAVLLVFGCAGSQSDVADDIAGFGATAVELLTGSRPQSSRDVAADLPAWVGVDRDAAKHLSRILRRALDPDVARRPESASSIVERIRAWRSADLPAGAVTFLLTDIEGSTDLWEAHPAIMASVITRHHEIVADCVDLHDGRQPRSQGEGDSTLSAFARATDAVRAALAIQHALQGEPWADGIVLRVRMGLHTGEAEVRGADYFGAAVSRTARIRALARGNEVLLSQATAQLAMDRLPGGAELRSMGRRVLKGLAREEDIFQLCAPGLIDAAWPLPETVSADVRPLPASLARHSPMIGRTRELDQLLSAWSEAQDSKGSSILIAGEPGIGKTRLGAEFASHVHAAGGIVLHGRCYEENLISYQPFREAIRQYADATPAEQLRAEIARDGRMLTRLLPELLDRVPDLPAPVKAEPDTERYLLFEAVAGVFTALSARAPVLLVIDDLHWADTPTVMLAARVARACPPARMVMLWTYRADEVADEHPLTAVIAALRREQRFGLISLRALEHNDVGELVRSSAAGASEDLVNAIAAETDGNPYFITELMRHLAETQALNPSDEVDSGRVATTGLLPDSVRDVIERRLHRLSPETRRVMALAAVIGREFELDTLQAVSDPEGDVLDQVEEAMRSGAVVEAAATGRYVFAHALIYSVLYGSITSARRSRLHLRIGQVLEGMSASEPGADAELAYHFLEAGKLDIKGRAAEYARRAGLHALDQLAHEDAARWFDRGIAALGARAEHAQRCDLLLDLAESCRRAGDEPALARALQAAAAEARELGDAERLARAAVGGFHQGPTVEPNGAVIALLEEALAALPERDAPLRARVLGALAVELYFQADRGRVIDLSDEAVAVARRVDDAEVLARILFQRQIAIHDLAHAEERLAVGSEILRLAMQVGDAELTAMAHNVRFQCLMELGEIEQADSELAALERLTGELRRPYFRYVAMLRAFVRSELTGDLDEAERLAIAALELGVAGVEPDALTNFGIQLYCVRYYQGRLGELVEACADFVARYPEIASWRLALALAQVHGGALDEARHEFDVVASSGFGRIPFDNLWGTAIPMAAEVCAALGDLERATQLYDLLLPYQGRYAVVTTTIACNGSVARYLGLLARTMGRFDEAARHFETALAVNKRIGAAAIAARTAADYASTLLTCSAPDRAQAISLIAYARPEARRMGLSGLERELDELEVNTRL